MTLESKHQETDKKIKSSRKKLVFEPVFAEETSEVVWEDVYNYLVSHQFFK